MSQLSTGRLVALGEQNNSALSYGTATLAPRPPVPLVWDSNAPSTELVGTTIYGNKIRWLKSDLLLFESCQPATCRLYTYNVRTRECAQVSASGADILFAGGNIWAKWTDSGGYVDSVGRTHAEYQPLGVDTDGTILLLLEPAMKRGLAYLSPTATSISAARIICQDVLEGEISATIRSGVICFRSGYVLRQYTIATETLATTNLPITLIQNDGTWFLGIHQDSQVSVVGDFTRQRAWKLDQTRVHKYPDLRINTTANVLFVTSSNNVREKSYDLNKYVIALGEIADILPEVLVYTPALKPNQIQITATTTPPDYGVSAPASDVVSVRQDRAIKLDSITSQFDGVETEFALVKDSTPVIPGTSYNLLVSLGGIIQEPETAYSVANATITFAAAPASGEPFFAYLLTDAANNTALSYHEHAYVINSTEWFSASGGQDIRGASQYGKIAVVAATNATGELNVTVKDSDNHTWASGEAVYGNTAVMIRPAPTSTESAIRWEVTWVRDTTTYARITLDNTLSAVGGITTNNSITFETAGILDIDSVTDAPLPTKDYTDVEYGYVRLAYPITRGEWTVGRDVSSTKPATVERILAWNSRTESAYVVWNANPKRGTITAPAHLTLEYLTTGTIRAAVVPAQRTMLIRESQWQLLTEINLLEGRTPGWGY